MNLYFQQVSLDADTDTTDPLRQVPQCFHFNVILCVCVSVCVCVCVCYLLSHVQLFAIPWTLSCQSLLFMGFPRQEYWGGFTFPSPRLSDTLVIINSGHLQDSRDAHWRKSSMYPSVTYIFWMASCHTQEYLSTQRDHRTAPELSYGVQYWQKGKYFHPNVAFYPAALFWRAQHGTASGSKGERSGSWAMTTHKICLNVVYCHFLEL